MRAGPLRNSRYSPGNMDRESLEALFVGREDLMEDVLARVEKSILGHGKHYVLLVGPRGSGKTHFLALAYHRLMDRLRGTNAQTNVAIALLKEEERGVASFLDLLVRILRALADEAPELNAEVANVYDRFSKEPAEAEALALARLRQRTRGKTLLLLCENLVDLFDGLGDEGQKRWRAAIQEDGNWAIVASTPSLFSAITLQKSPFYGFFTVRALDKMDFETSLDLLLKKAMHEGKTELAELLRTPLGRARARAIHHLAAGNHRACGVLFDHLTTETLDDLIGPFMQMVDDLTPYHQGRICQLAPAQRRVVEFLCLEDKPRTIKDISASCLMSHQTTAKQVSELEAAGLVSRRRVGRNTYCEPSDPLMRICVQVKDNRTQYIRLFVEFLRHWFADQERHVEAPGNLDVSLRTFRPGHPPDGVAALREFVTCRLQAGVAGRVLTGYLKASVEKGFDGDLAEWERELGSLAASLSDFPDCRIPIDMIRAAVGHAKTGDERHLLSLPLEQRQLLQDALAAATERT